MLTEKIERRDTTIRIMKTTKRELDRIIPHGVSYDEFIRMIIHDQVMVKFLTYYLRYKKDEK
jgi:hypothetical protein